MRLVAANGLWPAFWVLGTNIGNGTVALRAVVNNLFVSADLNIGDVLVANRAAASTWEQFTFTNL